jgi:hypothetical protein
MVYYDNTRCTRAHANRTKPTPSYPENGRVPPRREVVGVNPSRIVDVAMKTLLVLGLALTILVAATHGVTAGVMFGASYGGGLVVAYLGVVLALWTLQSFRDPSTTPSVDEVTGE